MGRESRRTVGAGGKAGGGQKAKRYPQVGALPVREDEKGRLRVLLVTSRDTGRWVVPKGWPIDGLTDWTAASIEALEEAGAEGDVASEPLGAYPYAKRLDDGSTKPCEVTLYPLHVSRLRGRWKEMDQRERRWFAPKHAAKKVDEPELGRILQSLGRNLRSPARP